MHKIAIDALTETPLKCSRVNYY